MQKIKKNEFLNTKKSSDSATNKDFLNRFSHLQELLKNIKDEGVKNNVKKDIENFKDDIEKKDLLRINTELVQQAVARIENTLREGQAKNDYNHEFHGLNPRNKESSKLENAIEELAKDLPRDKGTNNNVNYGVSNTKYGNSYSQNYESVRYNIGKEQENRKKTEHEFAIVEKTIQYGQSDVAIDIYNKERINKHKHGI